MSTSSSGSGAAPGANDPGVSSLIDGVLGDSVGAPQRAAVAAPPRARPAIQWPPRPATEPATPAAPEGVVGRLRKAMRGTHENTSAGLRTRTRVFLVLALTAAIVIAAVVTTRALAITTSTTFDGVLAAETPIQLNFPNQGTLATLDVTPGQTVHIGQLLASESSTVAAQAVHSDELALGSDDKRLAALLGKSGQLAEAQAAAAYQKVQSLAATQDARGAASVDEQTSILQSDQQELSAAQAQLATDTAAYNSKCSGLGNAGCAALSRDKQLDQNNVTAAEDRVVRTQAALNSAQGIDNNLINLANQEEQLAQQAAQVLQPTIVDDISVAEDAVAGDLKQLATDRQALEQDSVVSPVDGTVATTSCVPGELVSVDGCHSGSVSSSTGVPGSGSGLAGPSTVNGSTSGVQPLVTIDAAPGLEAIAQVPEVDITSIRVGETAHITVDALGGRTFTGKVMAIEQVPVDVQGSVYYDVVLEPPAGASWTGDLLPGMTASISTS